MPTGFLINAALVVLVMGWSLRPLARSGFLGLVTWLARSCCAIFNRTAYL